MGAKKKLSSATVRPELPLYPELFRLYFYEAVGQAVVRPELPLYPDHVVIDPPYCPYRVVVDRPHYAREVWAPAPLHRTG